MRKLYRVSWVRGACQFSRCFEGEEGMKERDMFTEGLLAAGTNIEVKTWENTLEEKKDEE